MKTTNRIQLILFCCLLQFTTIIGDCQNHQDAWKELIANDANDIEKLTKFFVKIRQEEEMVKRLRNAIFRYIENENPEELKNKINLLNITETLKHCENYSDEWKKIIEHNDYDLEKLQQFHKESKKMERNLSKLHESVGEYLIKKNAELLSNAINSYDINKSPKEISFIINNMKKNYKNRMLSKISENLISNVHSVYPFTQIPDIFWHLYQGDVITLEYMTQIQLSAGMLLNNNDRNARDQYNQRLSCILYKVQQDPLHEELSQSDKNAIENFLQLLNKNCTI